MAEGDGRSWDPTNEQTSKPSKEAIETILSEIEQLHDYHYSFVKVYFDEDDITKELYSYYLCINQWELQTKCERCVVFKFKVHVLMIGVPYTPYAGGFFYFLLRYPPDYPQRPPKVKLMNTGGGGVRFNPNIYDTGMVCHSILGTWDGPAWNPACNNLSDILDTIVGMLHETPYINEPPSINETYILNLLFPEKQKGDIERYNDVIRHETLRAAVCEMMEDSIDMPGLMRDEIRRRFKNSYQFYIKTCKKNGCLDGKLIQSYDAFNNTRRLGNFNYTKIQRRLRKIKANCELRKKQGNLPKKSTKSS